jgi:ABC-type multidrug transport system fused ATPase/permease subunit
MNLIILEEMSSMELCLEGRDILRHKGEEVVMALKPLEVVVVVVVIVVVVVVVVEVTVVVVVVVIVIIVIIVVVIIMQEEIQRSGRTWGRGEEGGRECTKKMFIL